MRDLNMPALFHNEWDEEKIVCQECFQHNGKEEVARLLNEGIGDDRSRFRFQRLIFRSRDMFDCCAVCNKDI